MRESVYILFFSVLVMFISCESYQGGFDESVPELYTLTTNVLPEEGGTIQPSGGEFLAGDGKQIVARPSDGYVFDRWSGDLSGDSNPGFIQFNSNRSVTAHFSSREYNLNLEIIGKGAVSETILEQSSSITVRLDADAEEEWFFDRWEGDLTGNSNPDTITIGENEELSIRAVFEEEEPEQYTLSISTEGSGTVEKDPDKEEYTDGEKVKLTADAGRGWNFIEWQGDLAGSSNPETIIVDSDKQVKAVFEIDDFGVTIEEVKFYISEMKLEGTRNTIDFKTKDFILNIPLDGSPFEITHVDVAPGFYDELELSIKEPKNDAEIGDPDFRDISGSYSLVVKGTFDGVDFTFRSGKDFKIETDISPHLEIRSGQTEVIAITINFEDWFMGENDRFLDPNDPRNREQIIKKVEDSLSNFEY